MRMSVYLSLGASGTRGQLLLACILLLLATTARTQVFNWGGDIDAVNSGGHGAEILDMTIDPDGNVITVGSVIGAVDMDPGPGELIVDPGIFSQDLYVSKMDANGVIQWVYVTSGFYQNGANGVATDAQGDIYVTGYFHETHDFNAGAGTSNLTASGTSFDIFIMKINADGTFAWAQRVGNAGEDIGEAITIDADGNIIVTGSFIGTVDFNTGTGTSSLSTPNGVRDAFVLKLDNAGTFIWAKAFTGVHTQHANDVITDPGGNIYVAGDFTGDSDFDPGTGVSTLSSAFDDWKGYLCKLTSTGTFAWVKTTNSEKTFGVALDANNNLVTAGWSVSGNNGDDIELRKYNAAGTQLWQVVLSSFLGEYATDVAVDGAGDVYITGIHIGTVDFDPGAGVAAVPATSYDPFICKLLADGTFGWAVGPVGTDADGGGQIAVSQAGSVFSTGYFLESLDVDPTAGVLTVDATSNVAAFILRLDQCTPGSATEVVSACDYFIWTNGDGNTYTESTNAPSWTWTTEAGCDSTLYLDLTIHYSSFGADEVYACNSYTWIDGVTYTESNSTAEFTMESTHDCDSTVLLYLTIVPVDTTLFLFEGTAYSNATANAYQWVDCDNGNAPIPGETDNAFTPTVSGSYAVEITTTYCTLMSECAEIIVSGIDDAAATSPLRAVPNPTSGEVRLFFGPRPQSWTVRILDATGREVYNEPFTPSTEALIDIPGSAGIYTFVATNAEGRSERVQVVKRP